MLRHVSCAGNAPRRPHPRRRSRSVRTRFTRLPRRLLTDIRPTEGLRRNDMNNDIREELVARVRLEIMAGMYDTPEKWEVALDRLADRLSHE